MIVCLLAPHPAQAIDFFKKKPPPPVVESAKPAEDAKEKPAHQKKKSPAVRMDNFKPFRGPAIGEMKEYTTKYEDTLVQLSRDNNIGFVEMRAANPDVDPWLPGAGVNIILPTMYILPDAPRRGIVINLPEMRLYYYGKPEMPPISHPLGIGREGLSTPMGTTTIVSKIENPVWRPTDRMRKEDPKLPASVPPGPDNPLGTHAMYLGWSEYRIHGTNKPFGIGRRSSSGCIRMYPEDIITLYPEVPVGTPVTVINQPVKAAWIGTDFYIEAHPTIEQSNSIEENGGMPAYELSDDDMREILKAAGMDTQYLDWAKIRDVIRVRNGYPVIVGKRPQQT
jgi:L,D-transpeptidase ErfK/SrfK